MAEAFNDIERKIQLTQSILSTYILPFNVFILKIYLLKYQIVLKFF